jgi:hypothetical protein
MPKTFRELIGYGAFYEFCKTSKAISYKELVAAQSDYFAAYSFTTSAEKSMLEFFKFMNDSGILIECAEIGGPSINFNKNQEFDIKFQPKETTEQPSLFTKVKNSKGELVSRINTPYAFSFVSLFLPPKYISTVRSKLEEDESIQGYLTDFASEVIMRQAEKNKNKQNESAEAQKEEITRFDNKHPSASIRISKISSLDSSPDPVALDVGFRKIKEVAIDIKHNYFNYLLQRFPTEGLLELPENIQNDMTNMISFQLRHNEIGDHSAWITSTIKSIITTFDLYSNVNKT